MQQALRRPHPTANTVVEGQIPVFSTLMQLAFPDLDLRRALRSRSSSDGVFRLGARYWPHDIAVSGLE